MAVCLLLSAPRAIIFAIAQLSCFHFRLIPRASTVLRYRHRSSSKSPMLQEGENFGSVGRQHPAEILHCLFSSTHCRQERSKTLDVTPVIMQCKFIVGRSRVPAQYPLREKYGSSVYSGNIIVGWECLSDVYYISSSSSFICPQYTDNMTNMAIHEQDRQGYKALTAAL